MKNILFLTKYFHPHVGGVEAHVQELTKELKSRGYNITIITNQTESNLPLYEKTSQFTLYRIPQSSFDKKISTWVWTMQHLPLFWRADVIHAHDVFWWILPIRFLLFWKKFFITFHGYEGSEVPSDSQIRAHQLWNSLSYGSLAIGDFHNKWYQMKTSEVSYGAISPTEVKRNVKRSSKLKAVYIGRLAEDVGIMDYLKAMQLLIQKGKEIELDVYGDGPQRKEAEIFVQQNKLPVTFYGFIKNAEEKLPHYDIAFVSRYLAILSALEQGVSVIAHANNEIKFDYLSLAPFSKWISIVKKPEEIVEKILQYKKVSSNDAENWANQQTWKKMANVYEKMWFGKSEI